MYAIKGNYTQSTARKTCTGIFIAAHEPMPATSSSLFNYSSPFSDSSRSTRSGEEHGGRRRRGSIQRQREKDQKTKDYLFKFTTPSPEQEISADPVSGITGEGRARCFSGAHSDTGKFTEIAVCADLLF